MFVSCSVHKIKSVGRSYLMSIEPSFGSSVKITIGVKFYVSTDNVKSNSYEGVLSILGLPYVYTIPLGVLMFFCYILKVFVTFNFLSEMQICE